MPLRVTGPLSCSAASGASRSARSSRNITTNHNDFNHDLTVDEVSLPHKIHRLRKRALQLLMVLWEKKKKERRRGVPSVMSYQARRMATRGRVGPVPWPQLAPLVCVQPRQDDIDTAADWLQMQRKSPSHDVSGGFPAYIYTTGGRPCAATQRSCIKLVYSRGATSFVSKVIP